MVQEKFYTKAFFPLPTIAYTEFWFESRLYRCGFSLPPLPIAM